MNMLANHMRITGLQVSNEDVDSRKAAVTSLKTTWGKIRSVDAIFAKAADVAHALGGDGTPTAELGEEVQTAVQKKASAFLYADRPLEVGIVAGVTASELLSGKPDRSGWLTIDLWAAALWSALGFQPALEDEKREALRAAVLNKARDRCIAGAEAARTRQAVPDVGAITLTAGAEAELGEAIKAATGPTIKALRRNAALDREELDFLWWAQLHRSRLLDRPLASIDEPARLVAAGIEGAKMLRRLPSDVHREIVLRTLDVNPEVDLAGLLAAVGDDRATLARNVGQSLPAGSSTVFPLIHGVVTEATDMPGASIERSAEEWGSRALLEAALLHLRATGPGEL
jgi:GTPase-associated system helical domain